MLATGFLSFFSHTFNVRQRWQRHTYWQGWCSVGLCDLPMCMAISVGLSS